MFFLLHFFLSPNDLFLDQHRFQYMITTSWWRYSEGIEKENGPSLRFYWLLSCQVAKFYYSSDVLQWMLLSLKYQVSIIIYNLTMFTSYQSTFQKEWEIIVMVGRKVSTSQTEGLSSEKTKPNSSNYLRQIFSLSFQVYLPKHVSYPNLG